jgi:hypothetical protein
MAPSCSIAKCTSPVRARGWCNKHYRRWLRDGDPEKVAWERGDPEANFWSKVEDQRSRHACWVWTGYVTDEGYGRFIWPGGSLAHRFSYALTYGPIADGADVDHMCHNVAPDCVDSKACLHRRCVNPEHLRAIPAGKHRGYVRLGQRGKARGAQQRAKTHCPRNHPYDEANTYVDKRGSRNCRTCRRNRKS